MFNIVNIYQVCIADTHTCKLTMYTNCRKVHALLSVYYKIYIFDLSICTASILVYLLKLLVFKFQFSFMIEHGRKKVKKKYRFRMLSS